MDRRRPFSFLASSCLFLAACGSSSPPLPAPTATAPPASAAPSAKPEEKPAAELPTSCETKADKWCLPPAAFVQRLCRGVFPNVALAMFAKGTPWTRVYLRVKSVEAWNASGGLPSSGQIIFEEELLVLAHRQAATGGMKVSGAGGSLDVLRWDGSCASLMEEEITTLSHGAPKHAKVSWRSLDEAIQNALLSDEKIVKALDDRKRECKGATTSDESPKCEKADAKFNDLVVAHVRSGGTIPPPAKVP
jgi:hypothetical protein